MVGLGFLLRVTLGITGGVTNKPRERVVGIANSTHPWDSLVFTIHPWTTAERYA